MKHGRIIFITRTWNKKSGGGIMRYHQVEYLRDLGWNVLVVSVKNSINIEEEGVILIENPLNLKIGLVMEHFGLINDYLYFWKKKAFNFLKDKVKSDDIILATTGGELATLELGKELKETTGSKLVYYFRDPIDFTTVRGEIVPHRFFHVKRDHIEREIINKADLILTVSKTMKEEFLHKYNFLSNYSIKVIYTGYVDEYNVGLSNKGGSNFARNDNRIVLAYLGRVSKYQDPTIFLKAFETLDSRSKNKISILFVGNIDKKYKRIFKKYMKKGLKIEVRGFMQREQLVKTIVPEIDFALLSLNGDYFSNAFPSKFYDYINFGLPIIAAIPSTGELYRTINENGYGIAVHYEDVNALASAINKIVNDEKFRSQCLANIKKDKFMWSMEHNIGKLDKYLLNLIGS